MLCGGFKLSGFGGCLEVSRCSGQPGGCVFVKFDWWICAFCNIKESNLSQAHMLPDKEQASRPFLAQPSFHGRLLI